MTAAGEHIIPVTPDQEWEVDAFRPEDAPGVAFLFRSVYGEAYPVPIYLDPDLLIRENLGGRVISSVARIPSGAIVGHNALFNSAPNPRIFESGAGVVHTLYRGGQGIFTRMFRHGIEMGKGHPGVDLIYGEPVCNHPYSQKMLTGQGLLSCAMEVSLMPAEAYTREKSAGGRVSTLLDFLPLKPVSSTVYVPGEYTDAVAFCYGGLCLKRTFETSRGTPESRESAIKIQTFDFAAVARVAVSDIGRDFHSRMEGGERDLLHRGIRVIQVWLNTGQPWVETAVAVLEGMGYFFGGVLPCWFGSDGLMMQKVLDDPDWDGTILTTDRNRKLGAIVRAEWERFRKSGQPGHRAAPEL